MSSGVSLGCGWLTLTPSRMDCTTLGRAEAWRWWTSRDSKLMMGLARAIWREGGEQVDDGLGEGDLEGRGGGAS